MYIHRYICIHIYIHVCMYEIIKTVSFLSINVMTLMTYGSS